MHHESPMKDSTVKDVAALSAVGDRRGHMRDTNKNGVTVNHRNPLKYLARQERFELPAYRFVACCSIQLSYWRATREGVRSRLQEVKRFSKIFLRPLRPAQKALCSPKKKPAQNQPSPAACQRRIRIGNLSARKAIFGFLRFPFRCLLLFSLFPSEPS